MHDIAAHRDHVCHVFVQNMRSICADPEWTDKERAGTVLLVMSASLGAAVDAWKQANPHLAQTPTRAVVADMLALLMAVHDQPTERKLDVIDGGRT